MSRPLFGEVLPLRPAAPSTRLTGMRFTFSQLFSSSDSLPPRSPTEAEVEPKSPVLGRGDILPIHLDIPSHPLSPAASPVSPSAYSLPSPLESPISPAYSTRSLYQSPNIPSPVYQEFPDEHQPGVDPGEQELADTVRHQQRRRRKHKKRRHHQLRQRDQSRSCCFMSFGPSSVRQKAIISGISGFLLAVVLTAYLSLALTNRAHGGAFHVLFILVIVVTTIIFCHSLIRLCMLSLRPARTVHQSCAARRAEEGYMQHHAGQSIEIAGDDEAAAGFKDDETLKPPPPAYGFLRGSVRVDPNQMFWHRQAHPVYSNHPAYRPEDNGGSAQPTAMAQPPGYVQGAAF